ncbi:MAG: N-acetyltransferase [Bacteroidia bacterium]|nr:N-acetyltransferase [Bacteroidia bacterium]
MEINIKFRAFKLGDELFVNKLREDEDRENKVGGMKRYVSVDREAKWIHDIIMNDNQETIYLAITQLDSDDIIGYTSISDIDYRNGTCFWSGIKLSRQYSGKGYGVQVALLIVKYVFEELRMVRCIGMCQEDHLIALNLMLKVGYIKEGLMRKRIEQ